MEKLKKEIQSVVDIYKSGNLQKAEDLTKNLIKIQARNVYGEIDIIKYLEYLNKNSINIDYGIISFGSVLTRNIPNKTYTKSGTIAKPLDRAIKYVAPYVNVLNELGIEWVCLVDDPRHFYNKILADNDRVFQAHNRPPGILPASAVPYQRCPRQHLRRQ